VRVTSEEVELGQCVAEVARQSRRESSFDGWSTIYLERGWKLPKMASKLHFGTFSWKWQEKLNGIPFRKMTETVGNFCKNWLFEIFAYRMSKKLNRLLRKPAGFSAINRLFEKLMKANQKAENRMFGSSLLPLRLMKQAQSMQWHKYDQEWHSKVTQWM